MKAPRGPDPVRVQMRNTAGIAHRSFPACIRVFPSQGTKNIYKYPGLMVRMNWDSSTRG